MSSIYDIAATTIDGKAITLNEYAGKTLLIVNVASKCGLTPQYEQLQALYEKYQDKGLLILGFPSNEFAGQEPGSEQDIQAFCSTSYGVDFPMFSKITVNSQPRHPLYQSLVAANIKREAIPDSPLMGKLAEHNLLPDDIENDILWNFEKFLVSKNGEVVGRFAPDITVDSPVLAQAIEQQLSA